MAVADQLPKDFEEQSRKRFSQFAKPELTFEQFLEIDKQEFARKAQLQQSPQAAYTPGLPTMTPCGNGDFEKGLDPNEWQGANGGLPLAATHPFATFTAGLNAGTGITDPNSHQTWVATGVDPIVGIPCTAPNSTGAVRIGNAYNGYGCELLSKTFTVTAAQRFIKFWYAIVLQDPGHATAIQPFFWVRVTDTATDTVIPGAINIDNGSDIVRASATNPFFLTKTPPPPIPLVQDTSSKVVYKNWACAQLNLSSQVGKKVTIEFITGDCGLGFHCGYAYIDNFCGTCDGSPEGTLTYDAKGSSKCGAGQLCFNYTLPIIPGTKITGTVTITLDIYQNGVLLTQMVSPTLTSGNHYCFPITPLSIPGIDPSLGGLDFVATGNFTIPNPSGGTTTLAPMVVGAAPDGQTLGLNNDYQIRCKFFSYAVKFVCGVQAECDCECVPLRPGAYATEINIYNQTDQEITIRKRVVPVVLAGAPAGREPRVASSRAEDKIALPPHAATMDDCCRIAELLFGAPAQGSMPLTVGFLEIISPVELGVTAVYTAGDTEGKAVSIDVEQIEPKIILI